MIPNRDDIPHGDWRSGDRQKGPENMTGGNFPWRFWARVLWGPGILFLSVSACAQGGKTMIAEPKVVPYVELGRYVGTWYEIARYPHRFQEGCVASKAVYALAPNGKIRVYNECRQGSLEGAVKSVRGTAKVVDPITNAKLKVTFFWPFYGDYWIIDLGKNYEYAVVGHPTRKYLWVLSRTPKIEEGVYRNILEKLENQGYDTGRLIRTPQPGENN
jgi:apolipoprotein D and lipocalin family protein